MRKRTIDSSLVREMSHTRDWVMSHADAHVNGSCHADEVWRRDGRDVPETCRICACVYTYICMYMYMCMSTCVDIRIIIHVYANMYVCICL